jgi:hypothetical protein
MEKYNSPNGGTYRILSISRTKENLSILSEKLPDEMKLSFLPYLVVDSKKKIISAILTGQFLDAAEKPLTNQLAFRMDYQIQGEMPIALTDKKTIKVNDNNMIVSIFDTTVGAFRGILFEWLLNSELQKPLPLVNLNDFLNKVQVSFS